MTLTCGIRVLYIATTLNQYWCKSQNTILFFVSPRHINLNITSLNIKCIVPLSYMRGQTDALYLTYSTVIENNTDVTQSTIISSNVISPFDTVQCHTLQHLQRLTCITPTYVHTYFQHRLPKNHIPTYV